MNKIILTLLFTVLLTAGAQAVAAQSSGTDDKDAVAIKKELTATAEGWNNGDLKKYLAAYVPGAKEMTSEGPMGGVEHIEQTMKNGFWKTGRPLQVLRYENIAVTMLGKKNALVTGQYVLSGAGKPDRKGWFTTVWVKTKDGWRMMHDHS
jgi:ketosteroid isomerase-like protein